MADPYKIMGTTPNVSRAPQPSPYQQPNAPVAGSGGSFQPVMAADPSAMPSPRTPMTPEQIAAANALYRAANMPAGKSGKSGPGVFGGKLRPNQPAPQAAQPSPEQAIAAILANTNGGA